MPRYLIKKRGRTIDYMHIPKGTRLQRSNKGVRAVTKTQKGVWHKGYKTVRSKNLKSLLKRYAKK